MDDINVKVELTANECAHLLNMLDYLKNVVRNVENEFGRDFSFITGIAQTIRGKVYQSMIDSKEISLYCAEVEKNGQELIDRVNELIKGN